MWIRSKLGKAKSFNVSDCYPVGGDWWDLQPTKISFANSIWGKDQRKRLVKVVKDSMAGRGRGRGPRTHSPDED